MNKSNRPWHMPGPTLTPHRRYHNYSSPQPSRHTVMLPFTEGERFARLHTYWLIQVCVWYSSASSQICLQTSWHPEKVVWFCMNFWKVDHYPGSQKKTPNDFFFLNNIGSNPLQHSCLESHEPRSLTGYRPWGHKELDTTEQLSTGSFKDVPYALRTS